MACAFNRESFEVPAHPISEASTWLLTLHGGVSEWSISGNYRVSLKLYKRETKTGTKDDNIDDDDNAEKARPEWGKAYEASNNFVGKAIFFLVPTFFRQFC